MFSFTRLAGADPVLGVEMASTGEVGCIGNSLEEALQLALEASKCQAPKKGILVSAGPEAEKVKFLAAAKVFAELGLPVYGTEGTAKFLKRHGYDCIPLAWPGEGPNDCIKAIREGLVDLVINIPKNLQATELSHGGRIRQAATRFGCSLLTNMEKTVAFTTALSYYPDFQKTHQVIKLPNYQ
jgi:carbamoyl-phosphate synthase large subunit